MYRVLFVLAFFFNSTNSIAQTSRLRFEPLIFMSYDFSYFNTATNQTTSNDFFQHGVLGKKYTKQGETVIGESEGEPSVNFGVLMHYELAPRLDISIGLVG